MTITKLIRQGEKVELSGRDIRHINNNKVEIAFYHELEKFSDIWHPQLLGVYNAFALLYEIAPQINHWVAVLYHQKMDTIYFYDPYGLEPDEELNFSKYGFKKELTRLLESSGKKVRYNKVKKQQIKENLNTCGRWCALRLLFRELTNSQFNDLITSSIKPLTDDELVTSLTLISSLNEHL